MSLLDDVSIVVTPNGYKAGELYAVVPVPTEGAEKVTNGDFSADSNWNQVGSNGWSIDTVTSTLNFSSASSYVFQGISTVTGLTYKVTLDIELDSGTIVAKSFSAQDVLTVTSTGRQTLIGYFTEGDSNANFGLVASGSASGKIHNVSVKEYTSADMDVTRATAATRVDENGLVNYAEVLGGEEVINGDFATDSDWTKGAGWTISGGSASHTGGASYLTQDVLQVNTLYKVNISVTAVSGGGFVQIYMGNSPASVLISQIGDYIYYFTSQSSVSVIGFGLRSLGDVTIDNVSVKEAARDNVPRIDYTGGGCPHILAEPQRTNLVTYSSDFTDSSWNSDSSNVHITRVSNAATSPSGENNATKLIGNNTTRNPSNAYIFATTSSGTPFVSSVFAKKGEYDYLIMSIGAYAGGYWSSFNLDNGTVDTQPTQSDTTSSIEDYGNGWYRCIITTTTAASSEICLVTPCVDGNLTTQYINTTNGIYVYGAQLEEGSYPTSYIPTSGSTVTRNQDQFTRDGIGSLINSTEGVLFVEIASLSESGNYRELGLSDGTTSNRVLISYKSTDNVIRGSFQGSGGANLEYTVTSSKDFHKIAVKWKVNDFALWVDGVERGTDTSGSSFPADTLNSINFNSGAGGDIFYGKVKQLQVYKTALTDAQLTSLTS